MPTIPIDAEAPYDLGPCCYCGTTEGVINIIMLDRRGPKPGMGWGCFACNLPSDGAIAVMCDDCVAQEPKFVCDDYCASGKRFPYDQLSPETFDHDPDVVH